MAKIAIGVNRSANRNFTLIHQNVGQMLPNLGFKAKEKTLTTCFISH